MTGITFPDDSTASFWYDPFGRRIAKEEGGVLTNFLYDGDRVYAEYDEDWELVARYTTEGASYFDPLISMRRGESSRFYMTDQVGSVRGLTNSAQNVTDAYQYDAFGNLQASSGSTVSPYRYVGALGYYTNSSTSLLHVGARYYASALGRFITPDPAREITNYPYARSNPVLYEDPSGEVNIRNCGRYRAAVESAVRAVLAQIGRGCLANAPGLAACVERKLRSKSFAIHCGGHTCDYDWPFLYGWTGVGVTNEVHLCWTACEGVRGWVAYFAGMADDPQPGLPYVLLHEVLHACGQDECGAYRNAERCFPGNVTIP